MAIHKLTFQQVRDLSAGRDFDFKSTAELQPLREIIGQDRAVEALKFGLDIRSVGYNIFVAGWPGTGRRHVITRFLSERAPKEPSPPDWCYVHNFKKPDEPMALKLGTGLGPAFARDVDRLIADLRHDIPRAFESEQYGQAKTKAASSFRGQKEALQEEFNERVRKQGLALQQTPVGLGIVPLKADGEAMKREEFEALPAKRQDAIHATQESVQVGLEAVLRKLRQIDAALREKMRELDENLTRKIAEEHTRDVCQKYAKFDRVCSYLADLLEDVVRSVEDFKDGGEPEPPASPTPLLAAVAARRELVLDRYLVNVFVSHVRKKGPPVIYEANPTHPNLFGRIERRYTMGALVTDFTMLKAGALHQANGGYLVLDAVDLLMRPAAWDTLKRCLESRQVQMEDLGQVLGYAYTETLKPEPIPMEAKVILVGNPMLYHLLYSLDEDFHTLFKVKAEFGVDMDRTDRSLGQLAAFIARQSAEHGLLPFEPAAVAAVANFASRLIEDRDKISTQFNHITDLLCEANHWAHKAQAGIVSSKFVEKAVAQRVQRSNLVEEKMQEAIQRGTLLIDVAGQKVGQVNGLVINQLGDYEFGLPARVTANVHVGSAGVVNIERRAELSGPIHTKGVEILASLLGQRFCQERPLTLSASLTFEQSYGGVEGDSASGAEYFALLSALAEAPINQSIAVTGSIDQKGDSQPVGGVTHKVEGFFDVCKMKGLTGRQGVIVPRTNVQNLVLRQDLAEAIRKKRFHIWAIDNVDDGIELLTGLSAGKRSKTGRWTAGSVNQRVDAKLNTYAEKAKSFAAPGEGAGANGTKNKNGKDKKKS
jgi:predicted ATP-dependent protease